MNNEKDTLFDDAVRTAVEKLNTLEPGSEEYKRQAESIACMMTAKTEKDSQKSRVIVPLVQTGIVVLSNLLLGGAIIAFEESGHFFTTKAFQLLFKPRPS